MSTTLLRLSTVVSVLLAATATVAQPAVESEAMSGRAFEGAQWVMATQAARAVAQVGARAAAGEGILGQSIRRRQQLEDTLKAARKAMSGVADLAAARAEATGLADALNQLDAEIRESFPEYADLANPKPLDYAGLRAQLRDGEALLLFLSDRTATYVWAVSKAHLAWHRAPIPATTLSDRVRKLRLDLDPTGPSRAAVSLNATPTTRVAPFDLDGAYALYRDLLAPVMGALEGIDHLFVVKDGALSSLPLAVLVTEAPEGAAQDYEDYRQTQWLIDRFALTTLPAVSSLASIRSGPATSGKARPMAFMGFGDPAFGGIANKGAPILLAQSRSIEAFFDTSGTRLDAIRGLAPLPGTARELKRIAGLFSQDQAVLFIGSAATETAVKTADLSRAAIVSFATHGLVTGDISGLAEPALALTPPEVASEVDDGLLTASEASALNLNADWVILSACNTAAGDGTPGAEGLSGLARAFLFAGARSILVSHWPVRDDVAATLTADTLQRLNERPALGRSQALRLAIRDMIADTSDPTLAHPSSWAPFVVVGEGGALE